jgi:hypothetical protein
LGKEPEEIYTEVVKIEAVTVTLSSPNPIEIYSDGEYNPVKYWDWKNRRDIWHGYTSITIDGKIVYT